MQKEIDHLAHLNDKSTIVEKDATATTLAVKRKYDAERLREYRKRKKNGAGKIEDKNFVEKQHLADGNEMSGTVSASQLAETVNSCSQ